MSLCLWKVSIIHCNRSVKLKQTSALEWCKGLNGPLLSGGGISIAAQSTKTGAEGLFVLPVSVQTRS